MDTFVIAGGGLAAAKAVEELRDGGFGGRMVVTVELRLGIAEVPPIVVRSCVTGC